MFEQIGTVIIVIVVLVVGAGLGLFAGFVLGLSLIHISEPTRH